MTKLPKEQASVGPAAEAPPEAMDKHGLLESLVEFSSTDAMTLMRAA